MNTLKRGGIKGVWFFGDIELWTTSRCAEVFGFTTKRATSTADKKMRRAGITPYSRLPGRGGESLWLESDVQKLL